MVNKKIAIALSVGIILNSIGTNLVYAESKISDLASTHFSYNSVMKLISSGIMVVDSKGNFYPSQTVNKFEFSKIAAKMLGHQEIDLSTISAGGVSNIKSTSKFDGLIGLYEKKFNNTWDKTANRQIAFLLEKGILKELDLAQFVIEYATGEKFVKSLTKQEFATWTVRVLEKETIANTYSTTYKFADDTDIEAKYKPHVYYLYSIGLFKGDDKGRFLPKDSIKKEILAVLIARTLEQKQTGKIETAPAVINAPVTSPTPTQPAQTSTPTVISDTKIKLYSGEIDTIYDGNYAVKIKQIGGISTISTLDSNVEIYKLGQKVQVGDLKKGDYVVCAENTSNIIRINITSASEQGSVATVIRQLLTSKGYQIVEDKVGTNTSTPINTTTVTKTDNTSNNSQINKKTDGKIKSKIRGINISSKNTIVIEDDDGKDVTYPISTKCEYKIGSAKKTIYDLRVKDDAELILANGEVTKISIALKVKEYMVKAKIKRINKDEDTIDIIDLIEDEEIKGVVINSNTVIYDPENVDTIDISDLKKNREIFIIIVEESKKSSIAKMITLLNN